jgi:hypothetical protein
LAFHRRVRVRFVSFRHKHHFPTDTLGLELGSFCATSVGNGESVLPLRYWSNHYNAIRLNSAIGYITPKDMLAGHQQEIQADRDRELQAFNAFAGTNPTG